MAVITRSSFHALSPFAMYQNGLALHSGLTARIASSDFRRAFSRSSAVQSCCSSKEARSQEPVSPIADHELAIKAPQPTRSAWEFGFWTHGQTWKRAGINTLRCLVGCTTGDFSALWMLRSSCPDLSMGTTMMISRKLIHRSRVASGCC